MSRLEKSHCRELSQAAVSQVQAAVEVVLQNTPVETLAGLSTSPRLVDGSITAETLKGQCGTICEDLLEGLKTANVSVVMCRSGNRNSSWHRYLTATDNGVEVIIDPSIGQLIQDYNQVFVGTRQQLQQLVLNPRTITLDTRAHLPQEVFTRNWGSAAQAM